MRERKRSEIRVEFVFNCEESYDRRIVYNKKTGIYTFYVIEPEYMIDKAAARRIVIAYIKKAKI